MRCSDIKQGGKIYLRLFSLGYRIHGNWCTITLHKIYVIYLELSLLLIRGQKCVNLILTETEKSTRISLFLYLFILPVPCSPGRASSFSNYSPLQVACLAPKHGPKILQWWVARREEATLPHWVHCVRRKREEKAMPLVYKRVWWQGAQAAQGARGNESWAKELQPKAGRGKVCNQRCLLAVWRLHLMGRVHFAKHQALRKSTPAAESWRKVTLTSGRTTDQGLSQKQCL